MQVLLVEPGKAARVAEIGEDLKSMQEIVGGSLQLVCPWMDGVYLICNDEGKLRGLPLNRQVGNDVIAGTFFLCSARKDSFCSPTKEQMERYAEMFQSPELFHWTRSGIVAEQCSPEEYAQAMQARAEQAKISSPKKNDPER